MNFSSVSGKNWIFKKFSTSDSNKISEDFSLTEILAKLISIRKKNIDDIRESPALKIAENFYKAGYDFDYSDPYISKIRFKNTIKKSKKINANLLKRSKIVLIATDHDKFNYDLISKKAKFIFDSRNVIKNRSKDYFKV